MKSISRRNFLTGVTAVGATTLALGAAGCAPSGKVDDAALSGTGGAEGTAGYSFETPPDPIAESDIADTHSADLIVVGAGFSGLCTAVSALESGLSVIVVTDSKTAVSRGGSNHAAYSKVMEAAGIPRREPGTFFKREMWRSGYNVDLNKWMRWWNNSEETMNWLIDLLAKYNIETILERGNTDPVDGINAMEPGSHSFVNDEITAAGSGQQLAVDALAEELQTYDGGEIYWEHFAEQLIREDDNAGRVTAVIAKGPDDKYVKFEGTKAIVLATGDFSADGEMMEKYCRWVIPVMAGDSDYQLYDWQQFGGLYEGRGQKMGLWVGAAWQKTYPNCAMIMDIQYMDMSSNQPYGSHRGLIVNNRGQRFINEDCNAAQIAMVQIHQPQMEMYAIWPEGWADFAQPFYPFSARLDQEPYTPEEVRAMWEEAVSNGSMWKADTVEDLVAQLELPEETLETIERYNGYCIAGEDGEFYKSPTYLLALDKGPFYGNKSVRPTFFTVLGGLRTNLEMQVCDADDNAIPGLYNVGSMAGDLFAGNYNFMIEGHSYGMCLTLGYLTGKYIAENE